MFFDKFKSSILFLKEKMGIRDIFRRKEDNVIDLRELQRRGIIKQRRDAIISSRENNDSEVVDFTDKTEESSVGALGFLSNLAGASDSSASDSATSDNTSSFGSNETGSSVIVSSGGKQKLRGVLRDMKLDMKNSNDRIYKLGDRIDLLEKKLERLERRANYGHN